MTRKRRILIAAVAVVGILFVWWRVANPLRREKREIRHWLLLKTPIGEHRDLIQPVLAANGWTSLGFARTLNGLTLDYELGSYQGMPWQVSVRATWTFDASDRLSEIEVEKIVDSP